MNSVQSTISASPYIPTATKVGTSRLKVNDAMPLELSGAKLIEPTSKQYKEIMERTGGLKGIKALSPPLNIEQLLQDRLSQANHQDTQAIIRMGGKVVGYMQTNGYATTSNSLKMEGSDNASRIQFLKQHYGNKISIEEFPPGEGPTHAEVYEAFSGRNYRQEMYSQYQSAVRDRFEVQQAQLRAQQQWEAIQNEPQVQKLTLEGLNITGWDQAGNININHRNLIQLSKQAGFDLPQTREIYRQLRDSESPDAATAALAKHFSSEPELAIIPDSDTLTRKQLMYSSPEQIRNGYL
ncbi:hypothetical protein [Oceanospirillum beijerinckii]|uniref:hypothetical protein n=1 Tax=Oceanospirillum beijerinckii TaxID=64976 RepID=UPI0004280236|nr:hypothetical protein [Oceanospirillum beijerinckii]